ncbi:predicted protein [Arabidopsis lyrata subsp. lyrata]|uniref:Predicted protein n=1 Tax=Arabidopsis lyrata subsp. lyrata TaxID=81972 RepID=D7LKD5_ARALL|nr:predicted protein [Arabidopsis lyrata subsp. lyrata]
MMMMVVMLGHCLHGIQGKLTVSSYLTISYINERERGETERVRETESEMVTCVILCCVFQVCFWGMIRIDL